MTRSRALGFDATVRDYIGTPTQAWLDAQAATHDQMLADRHRLLLGQAKIYNLWSPLPEGPYPPASDDTTFPRTGDPSLIVSQSGVTAAALSEPGRITQGLMRSAKARRPTITPIFWVGLACLGAGIWLAKK